LKYPNVRLQVQRLVALLEPAPWPLAAAEMKHFCLAPAV